MSNMLIADILVWAYKSGKVLKMFNMFIHFRDSVTGLGGQIVSVYPRDLKFEHLRFEMGERERDGSQTLAIVPQGEHWSELA